MKARHKLLRSRGRGKPADASGVPHRTNSATESEKPRPRAKHVGRVHGKASLARADRKPRAGRSAREFGGGLPPAANDNLDFETQLRNSVKNFMKGNYPAWRKDIANENRLLPLPGGKK